MSEYTNNGPRDEEEELGVGSWESGVGSRQGRGRKLESGDLSK